MEVVRIPEYIKKLSPKQCMPKMISYLAKKHPEMEHDQIVAIAASDCGISRKNDYGLDAGIRAALHLAHYKSKYPQLSLRVNLGKAYSKIKGINDFVEDFVVDGVEVDLGTFLWEHAQVFDLVNDTSGEGKWVTIRGKHIFIKKGQKLHFGKDGRYSISSKKEHTEAKEKKVQKKVEKTGKEREVVKKEQKEKQKARKKEAEFENITKKRKAAKKEEKQEQKFTALESKFTKIEGEIKSLNVPDSIMSKVLPILVIIKRSLKSGKLDSRGIRSQINKVLARKEARHKKGGQLDKKLNSLLKEVEKLEREDFIVEDAVRKSKTAQQLGKEKKKEATQPAREAKRAKAMTQKEAGSKRTKVAQALKKEGITPEASVTSPESISVPFTVINTESGNIVKGEVTENLKENTIPMTPVSSSNVKGVGQYRNELLVQFREGQGTYRYQFRDPHTAEEAYRSMAGSGSPGRWVWNNLRGHQAGEAITQRKIGPAIFTGKPTIGGTSASLVEYKVSGRTPSGTVQGYEKMSKKLGRSTSNPTQNPNTGSKVEKNLKQVKAIRSKLGQGSKVFQHLQSRMSSKDLEEDTSFDKIKDYIVDTLVDLGSEESEDWNKSLLEDSKDIKDWEELRDFFVDTITDIATEESQEWRDSIVEESDNYTTPKEIISFIKDTISDVHSESKEWFSSFKEGLKETKGRGWHGEPERHSKAAKKGKVGITKDFTMSGLLTRSGAFDYRAEGEGIKYKTPRNLEQVVNNTGHFPVFGKNGRGSHKEDSTTLIGFGHNLSYIPKGQVDNYAHIAGDVEFFYNIHDLSNLADPKNLPVSFSYEDLGSDGIQHMGKIHHLAVSLDASERDRCSTMDGTGCNINIKRDLVKPLKTHDFTHDQNLEKKVILITPNINQEKFTECDLKVLREDIQSQVGDGQLLEEDGILYYHQPEEKRLYELDFDKLNLPKIKQKSDTMKKDKKKVKSEESEEESEEEKEVIEEDLTEDATTEIQDGQKVKREAEGDDDEVEEKIKGDPYNETEKLVKSKDFQDMLKSIVSEALEPIKKDLAPIIANNLKVEEVELKTIQDLLKEAPYQVSEEAIEGKSLKVLKEQKDFLDGLPYIKNYTETLTFSEVNNKLFDFEPAEVDERTSVLAKAQADFAKNVKGGAKEV